jgi:hypothetical protein
MGFAFHVKRHPANIEISGARTYDGAEPVYGPILDAEGREQVSCAAGGKRAHVIVTLGQSNAANFAAGRYRPRTNVVNFNLYDGKCYRATDPLIGASGDGGNFATRLGDILIERGFTERVVLAPIGMGNTRIEDWSFSGVFNRRILVLIRRLFEAAIIPDMVLWQQGEGNVGDNDLGGHSYCQHLLEVVQTFRDYGISAPFMIALCSLVADPPPTSENVRAPSLDDGPDELPAFIGAEQCRP